MNRLRSSLQIANGRRESKQFAVIDKLYERLRYLVETIQVSASKTWATMNFNIALNGFSVRPAVDTDAQAVRMLLPAMRDPAVAFVAVDGQHRLPIGAAAATRSVRPKPVVGPGVAVEVIGPCRGAGVGGALLRELEQVAVAAGAKALYAAQRVEASSGEMQAWHRLGFEPCETVEEHVLPLEDFEPRLAPLVERLRVQRHIPTDARIIPLYQANLPAVMQLHLDYMGGNRRDIYRKLRGQGVGGFHPRYSCVLIVGDKVKGCILAHRADKQTAVVDANVVEPSLRGGWANVWLKLEATRGAMRLGIKHFRFTTFDQYADTRRFLKKMGGNTIRTTVLMMRQINRTATEGPKP